MKAYLLLIGRKQNNFNYQYIKNQVMKALMTNSIHFDVVTAKIRDSYYLKHLRQVQKINNRENSHIKIHLKSYRQIYQSHQKCKKQAKDFDIAEQTIKIEKKNQQINLKMKNIKSMFNFNNLKKATPRFESSYDQKNIIKQNESINNVRHRNQNPQINQGNHASQLISEKIASGLQKIAKTEVEKSSKLSLHYYLRKKQQEVIERQNQKLKNSILKQKSAYCSPKKLNYNLKLPTVKSTRYKFNDQEVKAQTKDKTEPNRSNKASPNLKQESINQKLHFHYEPN